MLSLCKYAALAFAVLLPLFSCSKAQRQGDVVTVDSALIPVDEATEEERAEIGQTLAEIESLSAELGQARTFRSLPILVTTENSMETKRMGACYRVGNRGKYIIVNRMVLEKEKEWAAAGIETTLFRVLLHEIGHCYFNREHLEDSISKNGHWILLKRDHAPPRERLAYKSIHVSSMESKTLFLQNVLKKYYVAELLGITRAQELSDFHPYTRAFEFEREATRP